MAKLVNGNLAFGFAHEIHPGTEIELTCGVIQREKLVKGLASIGGFLKAIL
jgi:hypothetical protein